MTNELEAKREKRFERLFDQCLAISARDDWSNPEWFAAAWGRAVEITALYDRQMGVPAQAPQPGSALAIPVAALPAMLPPGGAVATPDFSQQPAAGPAGAAPPTPSSDYSTAPAMPAVPPAPAPAQPGAQPAAQPAAAPAAAPASVFGPQFQGWPAVELEAILHAAQAWSLCRENNGTPEQFAAVLKDVTDGLEALAQRRIAMAMEKQGQA